MPTKASTTQDRQAFARGEKQGIRKSIRCAASALALAAADAGLCKNTVERLIAKSYKTFDAICEGRLTFDDVQKTLWEEYQITLEK